MAVCKNCYSSGLKWEQDKETKKWKLFETSRERHHCVFESIPLYEDVCGISVKRGEAWIAHMQTELCIAKGLDPYTTEFERVGDMLKVKKPTLRNTLAERNDWRIALA